MEAGGEIAKRNVEQSIMKTLKQILTCKEILEDEEAQGIIDEIIGLLRSKHITYACAYNILNGVMDALTEFSRQLPM